MQFKATWAVPLGEGPLIYSPLRLGCDVDSLSVACVECVRGCGRTHSSGCQTAQQGTFINATLLSRSNQPGDHETVAAKRSTGNSPDSPDYHSATLCVGGWAGGCVSSVILTNKSLGYSFQFDSKHCHAPTRCQVARVEFIAGLFSHIHHTKDHHYYQDSSLLCFFTAQLSGAVAKRSGGYSLECPGLTTRLVSLIKYKGQKF